jgi:hypothetical protein
MIRFPQKTNKNIMKNFNWKNVTDNYRVVRLLEQREKIEQEIRKLDENALMNYELEVLQQED